MNIFNPEFVNLEDLYFIATYFLESKTTLRDAAWELAIGQSVGNPKVRSEWETESLFKNHSVIIMADEDILVTRKKGTVRLAFPLANIDLSSDGVSQLLCQLMGGQMDIDNIVQCHLNDLQFPESTEDVYFAGPKFGISGIRNLTNRHDIPILGGIVKPKVIDNIKILEYMVHDMVDGGIDFIKEDEIMSNPQACPLELRVRHISKIIEKTNVVYTYCINSDNVVERAKRVYELGGKGIHVNFWSGMGSYKAIRDLNLPLFLHFQKSGDKILTNPNHAYHIKWNVICYLAGLMGVDSIHAGMWGGYSGDNEEDLKQTMKVLTKKHVIPALSCGMHPGLVQAINKRFGRNYIANVGGALHGHPKGTKAGVLAMRQAIDGKHYTEYYDAIEKWGLIE